MLWFSENIGVRDCSEFVGQRGLKHAEIENSVAQSERRGVRGDGFTDNLLPCFDDFALGPLAQAEALRCASGPDRRLTGNEKRSK